MKDKEKKSSYECEYKRDYISDWDIHRKYVNTFDDYEAMLIGDVYDSVSGSTSGSKITDSYTATLAIERAARVVGKLPEGVTESVAKADQGKAAFMDILRQKWIFPNANSQHRLDTKLRLWQLYSSVYGYMPMFYDWNIAATGYIGPDCWLWNPRNFVPQQGKVSVNDMDYATALTWLNEEALENIIENETEGDGWNREAIKELLEQAEHRVTDNDADQEQKIARDRVPNGVKKGICVATRYESGPDGEWVSFTPDDGFAEIRRLKNPHKNGRIPFVVKYSQPLFDSFYGLGDFQRAKPLQFARDGLVNFYFKGIKMNLIPPIIANANGVVKHTLDYREGAVMLETIPGSIRRMETSNAGLSTFQAVQSNLTGSLLSLFGTQNASMPGAETLNPSQGKTPAAINLYSDKEATRDGQERQYLESAIEDLTDGFMSLVVNIGTEDIPVALFSKDIEAIKDAGLIDIVDLFSNFEVNQTETGGKLTIKPEVLKGVEYRFNIKPGSTSKTNKDAQLAELERYLNNLGKFQNMFKDDQRYDIQPQEIAKSFGALTEIPNAAKFVKVNEDAPSPQEFQAQQEAQKQEQEMMMQTQQLEAQAMQQDQPPQPSFVGGQMFKDPLASAAAQHIDQL